VKFSVRKRAAKLVRRIRKYLRQSSRTNAAGRTFTRSVYGPELLDTPGDRTFELCTTGYGPFVGDAIRDHDRDFLFLDIGANLGLFSLLADRHPRCQRVVAIEPLPEIFANLQVNLQHNQARKVEAICGAVTSTNRKHVYLEYNPGHSGMSKIVGRRHDSVRAQALGPDAITAAVGPDATAILAKIDVEGAELDVLSVLRQTPFYSAIGDIIIEVSKFNAGAEYCAELIAALESDGFKEAARGGEADHYDALYRRTATQ